MPAKKAKPPRPAQVSPPDTRSGAILRRAPQTTQTEQRLSKIEETLEKIAAFQARWVEEPEQQRGRPTKKKTANTCGRRSVSLDIPSNNSMEEVFNSSSSHISHQDTRTGPVDAEPARHAGTRQTAARQPQRPDQVIIPPTSLSCCYIPNGPTRFCNFCFLGRLRWY